MTMVGNMPMAKKAVSMDQRNSMDAVMFALAGSPPTLLEKKYDDEQMNVKFYHPQYRLNRLNEIF
jgi:hypothetical protein